MKQQIIPKAVGKTIETNAHLKLFVSFFIVKTVVEQGQWKREKTIVQRAVVISQPFETKIFLSSERDEYSLRLPLFRYAIKMMGITISFAGKPRIKAIRITPSSPIILAKGSKKSAQSINTLVFPTLRFAASQMIIPAGIATDNERPKTKRVLSNTERTRTSKALGFL